MSQARLLARAFFGRLFESDLMPQGLPQVQLLIWALVFAGTPTFALPVLLVKKYNRLYIDGGLPLAMQTDRAILFTLSMLSIGVVGLLIWDGIYPDRRDMRILGPLPVRVRTFVAARLLALGRVFLLFVTAVCVPQAIVFGLLAWSYDDSAGLLRGLAAHLLSAAAACTFVFAVLVALQCLLLLVLSRRAAQRASVALQVAFAIGLIQLLFFLPQLGELLRNREQLMTTSAAALVPGVWFLAMYEWLAGFAAPGVAALGRAAATAAALSVLVSGTMYAASYTRISRLALEGVSFGHPRARTPAARAQAGNSPDLPLRRAIAQFVVRTILRSRQHRMIVALYVGIAIAFVFSSILALAMRRHGMTLSTPSVSLLSIPLLLQFFPLAAIRVVAAIPVEPKANWIFRAAEPADRAHAIDGVRDAMVRVVLAPTVGVAFGGASLLWGIVPAICHALFCWAAGSLLIEVLLASVRKIPFTCTYLPGRARLQTMWPFYVMAFTTYCFTLAGVQEVLLATPLRMLAVCALMLAAGHVAMRMRHRALAAPPGLRFAEEDPGAMFEGFRLSEGLAATSRPH